jgi:hypothetical protein
MQDPNNADQVGAQIADLAAHAAGRIHHHDQIEIGIVIAALRRSGVPVC